MLQLEEPGIFSASRLHYMRAPPQSDAYAPSAAQPKTEIIDGLGQSRVVSAHMVIAQPCRAPPRRLRGAVAMVPPPERISQTVRC
jgi:hypothetical protein